MEFEAVLASRWRADEDVMVCTEEQPIGDLDSDVMVCTEEQPIGDLDSDVMVCTEEQPIGDLDSGRRRPVPCSGRQGVLRYKRETAIPSIPCLLSSQPPESPVVCEACGEEAKPPLDLMGLEQVELFCCSQHQQLCEMLTHTRLPVLKTTAHKTTPPPDSQPTREEEAELQVQEQAEHRKQEVVRELLFQDNSHLPVDTCAPHSRTLSYRLSSSVPKTPDPGLDLDPDPGPGTDPDPGPGPHQQDSLFSLSYPRGLQVGVLQRLYPSRTVFLTSFPDGSAQIFYPSGLLALILLVDGGRRVCLVYDDHTPSQQPIRALFHSDGRATCYHSNGSVWLSLGRSGGECVSETGSRLRRWSWGPPGHAPPGHAPPASIRPLFLSLNPSMGLRVLPNKQVSLRFLSQGCQARLHLGGQSAEPRGAGPPHGLPTSREELLLLAGRVGVHLGLRRLQWCLQTPSSPRPPQPPRCLSLLAHRLLARSCSLDLRDRTFIHTCLQNLH